MRKLAIMLLALVMVSAVSAVIFVPRPVEIKGTQPREIIGGEYKAVGYDIRNWGTKCYWQAGKGNVCMQDGKIWDPTPKRFRTNMMAQKQYDIAGPVMRGGKTLTVKRTGSGPQTLVNGNVNSRFAYPN